MSSIAYRISGYNRRRKYKKFLRLLNPIVSDRILDIGFTEVEYSDNDNFLEKNYPHQKNIIALGVDRAEEFSKRYPLVQAVSYDGGNFPFKDKEFDIAWSNAVIEHVGPEEKQLIFLKEAIRVSRRLFLTTPNRNFPIEVHTRTILLHFLPKNIFDKYLNLIGKSWATGDYMNLLTIKRMKRLLLRAGVTNYQIITNKFLCFTLDFVVVIK